jgi:hypothetical protein
VRVVHFDTEGVEAVAVENHISIRGITPAARIAVYGYSQRIRAGIPVACGGNVPVISVEGQLRCGGIRLIDVDLVHDGWVDRTDESGFDGLEDQEVGCRVRADGASDPSRRVGGVGNRQPVLEDQSKLEDSEDQEDQDWCDDRHLDEGGPAFPLLCVCLFMLLIVVY